MWTKYADLLHLFPQPFSFSLSSRVSVSTHRPRYRYIAFRVEGPRAFSREEVLEAFHRMPDRPWLVDFRLTEGLVRATNLDRDATVRSLVALDAIGGERVRVTTLGTSGTIRKAREKYLS